LSLYQNAGGVFLKVVVIGATGVLGRPLIPRLVERGLQVRAIVRNPGQLEWFQRLGIEAVLGDILDANSLAPATAGCDVAVHIATAVPKAGGIQDWKMNDLIRREGTRNFAAACQANAVNKYVQQSIALLYGENGTTQVDEGTAIQPGPITESAADMEAIVQNSSLDWCILRGGIFYGTSTGREDGWRQAALTGNLQVPGDGTALISLVHVVDMARAIVLAVERAAARSIFNVVDDQPVNFHSLFDYIAAQVNGPEPRTGGEAFLPSLGCSNRRIKQELAWEALYPTYRSGLA
jgi:2-alkyl-3-oxoalkanoate reductase